MKLKALLISAWLLIGGLAHAQSPKVELDLSATEVISQGQTGTCWSFCTTSFLESEALRLTGERHDFSEMAHVRVIYPEKVERYLRYHGHHQFGPGGLSHDVTHAAEVYGMVPQSVYNGREGAGGHNHKVLDRKMKALAKKWAKSGKGSVAGDFDEVDAILDAHLGPLPTSFQYQGTTFTPVSFRDAMGIDPASYVTLSSFAHHPFGAPFILEVPDNHALEAFWNVPLDALEAEVHHALDNGFTVAWDADVSNEGFSFLEGWAIMPETAATKEQWGGVDAMPDEPLVDQSMRQVAFDTQENTDDHLMHIVGRATDAQGRRYFVIKNSWGQDNPYGGQQFVSMSYFRHHTMGVMVHEAGISPTLRQEMGR